MDNTEDDDFVNFLSQAMADEDEEEDVIQYKAIWDCPKINKFTNEDHQKVWSCGWCPDKLDGSHQSHFLGGTTSKQFAMLLALVDRASTDAEAGFL